MRKRITVHEPRFPNPNDLYQVRIERSNYHVRRYLATEARLRLIERIVGPFGAIFLDGIIGYAYYGKTSPKYGQKGTER
jgi:hypothetical protein